jgi:integrase/recombinase XerD
LDKPEAEALLRIPEPNTELGARDYAVLLFLYNTGARADEAAQLKVGDLTLNGSAPCVRVLGKGNKVRVCPLWKTTVDTLKSITATRD